MAEPWQGKLWVSCHIACARCRAEDEAEIARPVAVKRFKTLGWREVVKEGWVCPECVQKGAENDA